MAVLKSLLSRIRNSRKESRKPRRKLDHQANTEALEERLLLTNPDLFDSNPGAPRTIYLDFNGHTETSAAWQARRSGSRTVDTPVFSIDGNDAYSDTERKLIEEIFLRVKEDFAPFGNVNITTEDPGVYRTGETLLVSIGGHGFNHIDSNDWWSQRRYTDAIQNGFNDPTDSSTTVFVFARDYQSHPVTRPPGRDGQLGRDIANGISSAVGIAMGLQERPTRVDPENSWLVGTDSYPRGLRDTWSETIAGTTPQDDIATIASGVNNITLVADDHGDTFATATAIATTANQEIIRGLIGSNSDVDRFAFSTGPTTATFSVRGLDLTTRLSSIDGMPFSDIGATNAGSNLDPTLRLYDANGVEVAMDNQPFVPNDNNSLTATFSAALTSGNYYLEITNNGDYGSLGEYEITIDDVDQSAVLAVPPRQSNPGATSGTFFLDFNGHQVSNPELVSQRADGINQPFFVPVYDTDGDRTNFSAAEQAEMIEIFERVAEDFAPFDVNVTTADPFSYGNLQGMLVAIGGDGTWLGPVGTVGNGIAELSTFSGGVGDNNGVTFADNLTSGKEIALEATNVIATALGIEQLTDHSGANPVPLPGTPAVGAIRGDATASLRDVFLQGDGPTQGVILDPLAQINSAANRILYAPDDHGNTFVTASAINVTVDDEILTGVIGENGDEDWFSFQTLAADATIEITGLDLTVDSNGIPTGVTNPGANLDPVIELISVDSAGNQTVIASDGDFPPVADLNDANSASLKASFTTSVAAGLYYIRVSTRGEYGNLGQYTITMRNVDGTPAVLSFVPDPDDPTVNSIREDAGTVVGIGRVERPFGQPTNQPLNIDLVSTDLTELNVPATVTIEPGQQFVTFDVTAVDDTILDGDQNVIVEAYVDAVLNSTAILKVSDVETISASVTPNPVAEDAGPAGATLTVTRSNTDIDAANHWVAAIDELQERDPAGNVIRTIPVEWPNGVRPLTEIIHDVQVMENGNIAVYNGTGTAFLSIFNLTTGLWQHYTAPGLSTSTDATTGGVAAVGDFVFLTDLEAFDNDERGLVRVNTVTGEVERFADSSVGSRLYILSGTSIVEINAVTGEILNTITPQGTIGAFTQLEAIAFDGTDLWALFDSNSIFGSGGINELQRLNPDTGEVLEIHSIPLPVSNFFSFNDNIGMTTLNGLIYFNLPFDTLGTLQDRAIQAYNPENRQLIGGLLPFEALNNIYAGQQIGSLKGDGTAVNPDVLLVHGRPDITFFGDDRIYLLDPTTGRTISSIVTGAGLGFFSTAGVDSLDDVIIGNTIRNGLIYLNLDTGLQVYERNGTLVDVNPATVAIDQVPHAVQFGFDYAEIAGADVPGVSAQELSFRDVSVGVEDELLYGLVENGLEISVYDPATLVFLRTINLDTQVNSISVDEDGNILAGGANGDVRIFDANGATIAVLNTTSVGLANVADVDTNISTEIIIADTNGIVLIGPRDAVFQDDVTLLQLDSSTAGTTSFASFGRHSSQPTGPLVVTLSSSDITELQTPVDITIPVGQTSASIAIDVIDDNELDGPQVVTITGNARNYLPDSTDVTVLDAEFVGVEIRRESVITISDPSLFVDGDRVSITVNGQTYVFEFNDTATANGIAASSQYTIDVDLSSSPSAATIADAIAASVTAANIGISAVPTPFDVTLSGSPNFPTVELFLSSNSAATAEKPLAETAGLVANGIRVFRTDIDGPFVVPASTSGSVNVPVGIADDDVTLSQITVEDQVSRVTDVNVKLSLQHRFLPDLDITLVSPQGTRVALFKDLGSNESELTDTVFDDEAASRIVDGVAPYTGSFIPHELLSGFDGEDPSGVWTLEVVDDNVTDTGTLFNWSLEIETLGISETQFTLVSSDETEAIVSAKQFAIPAARSEVFVDFDAVDDSIVDGTIPVTISIDAANVTGFNLGSDVVDVTDVENLTLTLDATSVSEGGGSNALTGTITRTDTSGALTVHFTSSDTSELTVPSPVVIPDGNLSAPFTIDAVDDLLFDGDQTVTITASAAGHVSVTSPEITVVDQEPRLSLTTVTTSVPEDAGTITISLARLDATDLSQPQQVRLQSSDLTELSVPTNFVIGINTLSTTFTATILEDDILDGPQVVTITASDPDTVNPSVNSATLDITVEDAEFVEITVPTGEERFLENAGAGVTTATVSVSSIGHTAPIVVTLSNGDTTEVSIPDQVIIPVNETSVTFPIDAVNDDVIDRDQAVVITGTATGYRDGVLNLTVGDHEPPVPSGPASVIEDSTPTLQWGAVDGATRYDLWVNDVSRDINQLFRMDNIPATETSFTPAQALGVGRYRYWVRAYDDLEQPGFWSQGLDFQVRTRPVITAPANQSSQASAAFPEISWTTVVDTDRYDLWVNNVTTGQSQVIRQRDLQTTSFASAVANLPGGTYRAWTRASVLDQKYTAANNNVPVYVDGFWSAPVTFTVLSAPTNIRPSTATFDRTPRIEWDAVEGATSYYVWLTLRNPGQPPVVVLRDRFVTDTFRIPENDLETGDYVVWVKAIAADDTESAWSPGVEFSIGGRPVITAPADDSFTSGTPIFLWRGIEETARYEIWINRTDVLQSRVVYDDNIQGTSFAVQSALQPGTYRVWVRAVSDMGETSGWSIPVDFTVAAVDSDATTEPTELLLTSVATTSSHATMADRYVVTPLIQDDDEEAVTPQSTNSIKPQESVDVRDVDVDVTAAESEVIDNIIAEWCVADWSTGQTEENDDESASPVAAALGLGLMTTGSVLRRPKRRHRENE